MKLKHYQKFLRKFGIRIANYETTTTTCETFNTFQHFQFISKLVQTTKGAFIECGFGMGKSFSAISYLAESSGREIYGFDTFEGFPRIESKDISLRNPKKGQWNVRTLKEAERQIKSLGISNLKFELIKGPVEVTIPAFTAKNYKLQIALLHIDLDLYSGYQIALEKFYPFLTSGSIICIDDYNQAKWPGCQKAVDEFLALHPNLKLSQSEFGKFYVIKD